MHYLETWRVLSKKSKELKFFKKSSQLSNYIYILCELVELNNFFFNF